VLLQIAAGLDISGGRTVNIANTGEIAVSKSIPAGILFEYYTNWNVIQRKK